jgi:hypothetical protein
MSTKEMKNVVASVLARLRNISKSSGAPFQQILQQYAIERFLYRISKSTHAQGVVLKGALLLKTIGIPGARPTMDIDMLRKGKADQASLVALVKDCATLDVEPDGLTYIADSATPPDYGSRSKRLTVPKTVPVLAEENRAIFRLSLDACGRPNTMKFRGLGAPQLFRDFLKSAPAELL